MNPTRLSWLALIGLAGCAPAAASAQSASAPSASTSALREELLRTDAAFSAYAAAHGVAEAFGAYLADDAVAIDNGADFVHGRAPIVAGLAASPGTRLSLTWEPLAADVAASGDLGYTYGRYTADVTAADGAHRKSYGKYMTVWRRQPDGSWKAVVDMGNKSPDPA